jgi:hypothetical protein
MFAFPLYVKIDLYPLEFSTNYSWTRLKRYGLTPHLVYTVTSSVVPINSSLLKITLYSSFITTQNIQHLS